MTSLANICVRRFKKQVTSLTCNARRMMQRDQQHFFSGYELPLVVVKAKHQNRRQGETTMALACSWSSGVDT